jgi:hypothetical protein
MMLQRSQSHNNQLFSPNHLKMLNYIYTLLSGVLRNITLLSVVYLHPEYVIRDRLCGLLVGVPGYRPRGPGSIPVATRFSEK